MLKDVMARARKKIDETERKADKVEALKVQREHAFISRRADEEREKSKLVGLGQDRLVVKEEIRERRYQMYVKKRQEAEVLKDEKARLKREYLSVRADLRLENHERQTLIRQQRQQAQVRKTDYMISKIHRARQGRQAELMSCKDEIYEFEKLAEELEQQESLLLSQLAKTQDHENRAYQRLKTALAGSQAPITKRVGTV